MTGIKTLAVLLALAALAISQPYLLVVRLWSAFAAAVGYIH